MSGSRITPSPTSTAADAPLGGWPLLWTALPLVVTVLALAVLEFAPVPQDHGYRIALGAILLLTALHQANRLRDRNRRIAMERAATRRLTDGEERLRTLLARLPTTVYLDRYRRSDGRFIEVVYVSSQMAELTGHPVEAFLRDPDLWLTLIHPDDRKAVAADDIRWHLSGELIELEYRLIQASGNVIWIREEARVVAGADDDTVLSQGFYVDITERKALEQQLGFLAFHDALTGLANRASFVERLDQAFVRGKRSGVFPAVLFLDLDEFKTVNDSLGHDAGDRLLTVVGERLRAAIRPADCVARLGGDEFAILLEDGAGPDVAIATATRLLALLRQPIDIELRQITGRGSIGIAIASVDTVEANDLLRDADAAMYRAKAEGRGRSVLFEPSMHTEALARFDLEADLRAAVGRGEIRVAYQPIYSLETGMAGAVEALARWEHPSRGSIPPLVFIDIAEASDLIFEIGQSVMSQACRQVAAWRAAGTVADDFVVSVNLSARQLTAELPGVVDAILRDAGLPARNLVIEVTESAVMQDASGAIEILTALRRRGIAIAIDDFGTGYSSLGYLRTLPIDIIKIDRSFVANVEGPFESALIQAVVQIADALSLRTVAEGIETESQAAALTALGCNSGQGFLYGRPRPADACDFTARQPRPRAA